MFKDLCTRLSKRSVDIVAGGHGASTGIYRERKSLSHSYFDFGCVQVARHRRQGYKWLQVCRRVVPANIPPKRTHAGGDALSVDRRQC